MNTSPHFADLDEHGYTVLPDFASPELVERLKSRTEELFSIEGTAAGKEFKREAGCRRLANLADKGDVFLDVIAEPAVLTCVRHVLGEDFKLSSLNARSVDPHSQVSQPLHADMGAIRDARGSWVCNVVWMLDPYTPENGPLRIVPGSHRFGTLPADALRDPAAPHPDEVIVTGSPGTLVVVDAHTWHGGLANRTGRPRTALHAFYCRGDKPQQQYQRALLREETQRRLSPELRRLLALDDPRNDALSREVAVRSGFLK